MPKEKPSRLAWRRSLSVYPFRMYMSIMDRIKRKYPEKKREVTFTQNQFKEFVLNDKNYPIIHQKWAESGYKTRFAPSVDRIDNNSGYSLDNIQIITHHENIMKRHHIDHVVRVPKNRKVI